MSMASTTTGTARHEHDHGYDVLEKTVTARISETSGPLFTTDAHSMWEVYLERLPEAVRQHYNCHACRRFIERYGGLVTIDSEGGRTTPLMWSKGAGIMSTAVRELRKRVAAAKVTGVFITGHRILGEPLTGEWGHLSGTLPSSLVARISIKNAAQQMAEKKEDYGMLRRSMAKYDRHSIEQAASLLGADALSRSDKSKARAAWLLELYDAVKAHRGRAGDNLAWRAVATAPAGWCHVQSSVLGALLEDIAAGKSFEQVAASFRKKMEPTQYRRPTAAPSAGVIAEAEKIVAKLNSAGALRRRYARLEDLELLWSPTPPEPQAEEGGVFSHLLPGAQEKQDLTKSATPKLITWERFLATVVPDAIEMACSVPHEGPFYGMTTASDYDAPPIIQWDREDRRNPVSFYTLTGHNPATHWGLRSYGYAKVTGISLLPFMWGDGGHTHFAPGALFVLDTCRSMVAGHGNALFPETLRSEYHSIRRAIEAYSRTAELEDREEATACGLCVRKDGSPVAVRVTTKAGTSFSYKIDRWE